MSDRRALLARIHIARKRIALPDAEYREIMRRGFGVASAAALDDDTLAQAVATIEGMEPAVNTRPRRQAPPKSPQERKIWALWLGGDDRPGLIRYLPDEKRNTQYLAGMLAHIGQIEWDGRVLKFDRFTANQARKAIELLNMRIDQERIKLADVPF